MGKALIKRRSKNSPSSIGSKLAKEIEDLVARGFTGSWEVGGSMRDGGIGSVGFKSIPAEKDLLSRNDHPRQK